MADIIYNVSGDPIWVPGLSLHTLDGEFPADVVNNTSPPDAPSGTGQHPLSTPAIDDDPYLRFDDGSFLFDDHMWSSSPVQAADSVQHQHQNCSGTTTNDAAEPSASAFSSYEPVFPTVSVAASQHSASGNESGNESDGSSTAPPEFLSSPLQLPAFARPGAKCPVGLSLLGYATIRQIMVSSLTPQEMLNSIAAIAFQPSHGANADEIAEYNEDATTSASDSGDDEDTDDDDDDYDDTTRPSTSGKGYRNSAGKFSGNPRPTTAGKYPSTYSGKARGKALVPPSSPASHTTSSSFQTPSSTGFSLTTPTTSPASPSPAASASAAAAYSIAPCENTRSHGSCTGKSVPASAPITTTSPKKKAIQMRWTSEEHTIVRSTLQAIVKNNTASTEQRFELVADALNAKFLSQYQAKYGPEAKRTKWSVKNQVTRVTRAMDKEAGIDFDDRKARKDGKERAIVTSARANKKRIFDDDEDDDEVDEDGSDDNDEEVSLSPAKRQRL